MSDEPKIIVEEAWRSLQDGKMVEVVNGKRGDREITTTLIIGAGQVIDKPLTANFVERWAKGGEYERSLFEHGRVELHLFTDLVDEDGKNIPDEERPVFVVTAGPGDAATVESSSDPDPDALKRAEAAEASLATAQSEIDDLKLKVEAAENTATTMLSEAKADADAKISSLQADLDEAEAVAASALSYNELSPEALQAEVDKKGLTPTGTGSNGNIVKADLVKALLEARTPA